MENTSTGHTLIDTVYNAVSFLVTATCLIYAEYVPALHIHMPVFLMEFTQWTVRVIGGIAGILTVLNLIQTMFGYTPKWVNKIRNRLKDK
jgi:hypothetical protein